MYPECSVTATSVLAMIKVKVKFTLEQAMNAQKGSRGITTRSLTSALDGGGWLTPCPGRFTHCIGGWVLTGAENLAITGIRSPDHPAHTESSFPAHSCKDNAI